MLLDKLNWVQHEGTIYSVHAQPGGPRFATGGMDQQVKIWNLAAALDATLEAQPSTHKLLAVLAEHTGPVNVVRFSNGGKFLASGSDDAAVIIYQQQGGAGGALLGSSAANVENWRPKLVLRGHATNVGDLAWCHDDSKLATASIDRSVMVWDAANGHRIATLQAHSNFVKGVQWDPVGSYLVSQSDDRSVVVYRTSDWERLCSIDKPYRKMITSTFATRLSFSPDGQFLLTGNSFQRGNHTAVVIPRGQWEDASQVLFLAGHTGAVVSTAFNPKMFHLPVPGASSAPANGKVGAPAFSEALTSVFATGGQDKRVVVWTAGRGRPLFAGKAFFQQQVTDLAWTSDGYALLACSGDGTVGVFQFSESELGRAGSSEEVAEVMRELYGDRQRGVGGGLLFAESVDQLPEEQPPQQEQQQQAEQQVVLPAAAAQGQEEAAVPSTQPAPAAAAPPPAPPPGKPASSLDALTARLEGRLGGGGDTQVGFTPPAPSSQQPVGAAKLVTAVRGGDGRKRIVPESTGGGAAAGGKGAMPPPSPRLPAAAAGEVAPTAKRQRPDRAVAAAPMQPAAASRAAGAAPPAPAQPAGAGAAAVAPAAGGAAIQAGAAAAWAPMQLLQAPAVRPEWSVRFREDALQGAAAGVVGVDGEAAPPLELRIVNRERGVGGRPQVELGCMRGRQPQWSDLVSGSAAVCACGTPHFAAVGLQDGSVLLYSPAGRRLGGPFKLGAGLARLACDSGWLLLALTTTGRLKLLHVGHQRAILSTSVAPLVEDGAQVADARLSRQGWPMLTLSSHKAYLYHPGLEEWMCVAEEAYRGSPYVPTMRLQNQGELTGLQAEVVAGTPSSLPRSLLSNKPSQQHQSRALLEGNLAAALCLRSPQDYRRWLGAYAQLLAEMGDEGRLRELCMELMGPADAQQPPPHQAAAAARAGDDCGGGDTAMVHAAAAAAIMPAREAHTAAAAGEGGSGGSSGRWQPQVLGLDKREDLLSGEVLRVASRSRVVGGLVGEMRDMLEDLRKQGEELRRLG